MRPALIPAAPLLALLAACGSGGTEPAPERRSAAGAVLGGEVSDDMLPLDTVRSTSPAGRSGPDTSTDDEGAEVETAAPSRRAGGRTPPPIDSAEVGNGPQPDTAQLEDAPAPSPTPE